ncbi:GGDEF domain-containing protein [Catenulispora subtropica]|uniref:GGDEF domain-containing protein n=1 Tax=Catenulispora subtropica TaxID=450798 RepID=UPI0031D2F1D7
MTLLACGYVLGRLRARARCRRLRLDLAMARHLAEHDSLTGLMNRSGAQHFYETRTAAGTTLAAVLVDLDGFKAVNDTWGHQVGDAQLMAVARRLTDACASIGAVASRLSGDEFLLLVPDADADLVQEQVMGILAQLGTPITLLAGDALMVSLTPGASAGIAVPQRDEPWSNLLRHADIALYQAKSLGGQAVLYTSGMQHPARRDLPGVRLRNSPLVNYA